MTEPTPELRVCLTCGCEKLLSEFKEFWDNQQLRYRRRSRCVACRNFAEQARKERARKERPVTIRAKEREKARRYREQHPERYNEYHREYMLKQKLKKFQEMLEITNHE